MPPKIARVIHTYYDYGNKKERVVRVVTFLSLSAFTTKDKYGMSVVHGPVAAAVVIGPEGRYDTVRVNDLHEVSEDGG